MDRQKENAKFQRQACWAFLTVAGSDEASRMIIQGGGISGIINAMVYHRHDSGVQQFGCWSMSNIALAGDDIKRKLRKAGALEVCRIAIETHVNDVEVLRQARGLIGVLGPQKEITTNQGL